MCGLAATPPDRLYGSARASGATLGCRLYAIAYVRGRAGSVPTRVSNTRRTQVGDGPLAERGDRGQLADPGEGHHGEDEHAAPGDQHAGRDQQPGAHCGWQPATQRWDDADLRRSTRAEVFRVRDGLVVNIRDDDGRPVSPTPWCSGVSPPTGCAVPGRQG